LYYLAHKLVSSSPNLGMSWFAVGCYYYYIKKYDTARKFFQKCNSLDKHFAPGWIAYGHCFACQNESDQAMAAYRTAARLFPGCYYAHLCIGMEYLRTNNLKTALLSLNEANNINYNDPQVHNEIGVVHYKEKNYEAASTCFVTALSLCKDESSVIFEAVCKNLANCYRKQKEYDNAIELYERCIHINPKNSSLYSSLGFTYHLKGKFKMALDCYHKANYLKPDDALTSDLISKAMEDIFAGKIESGYFNMSN
jgi:anaphase-promoting complex subunit 6